MATYSYDASGLKMSKTVGDDDRREGPERQPAAAAQRGQRRRGHRLRRGPRRAASGAGLLGHHALVPPRPAGLDARHHQRGRRRGGTFQYDPYGTTVASTGSVANPLQYAGQCKDAETGLYYMRARYYDPTTAQFDARDPMTSHTREPYGYAGGQPLNSTDPSGLGFVRDAYGDTWSTSNLGDAISQWIGDALPRARRSADKIVWRNDIICIR